MNKIKSTFLIFISILLFSAQNLGFSNSVKAFDLTKEVFCKSKEIRDINKFVNTDEKYYYLRSKANYQSIETVADNTWNKMIAVSGFKFGTMGGTAFQRFGFAGLHITSYGGEWKYNDIDPCSDSPDQMVGSDYGQWYTGRYEPQAVYKDIATSRDSRTQQFAKGIGIQNAHYMRDSISNFILGINKMLASTAITLVGLSMIDISEFLGFNQTNILNLYNQIYNGIFLPFVTIMIAITGLWIFYTGVVKNQVRLALQKLLITVLVFIFSIFISAKPELLSYPNKLANIGQGFVFSMLGGNIQGKSDMCSTASFNKEIKIGGINEDINKQFIDVRNVIACRIWENFAFQPFAMAQFGDNYKNLGNVGNENSSWVKEPYVDLGNGNIKSNWALFQQSTQTDLHQPIGEFATYVNNVNGDWYRIVDALSNVNYKEVNIADSNLNNKFADILILTDNITNNIKSTQTANDNLNLAKFHQVNNINNAINFLNLSTKSKIIALLIGNETEITFENLNKIKELAKESSLILMTTDNPTINYQEKNISNILKFSQSNDNVYLMKFNNVKPADDKIHMTDYNPMAEQLLNTLNSVKLNISNNVAVVKQKGQWNIGTQQVAEKTRLYLTSKGYGEWTDVILAIYNNENGGAQLNSNTTMKCDPWQSNESQGLPPCNEGSCSVCSGVEKSFENGMKHFISVVDLAKRLGFGPMEVLQTYNYGLGYMQWLKNKGYAGYTVANSREFANTQAPISPSPGNNAIRNIFAKAGVFNPNDPNWSHYGNPLYAVDGLGTLHFEENEILEAGMGRLKFSGSGGILTELDDSKQPTKYWDHWIGNNGNRVPELIGMVVVSLLTTIPMIFVSGWSIVYGLMLSILIILLPIFLLFGLWSGKGQDILMQYINMLANIMIKKIVMALFIIITVLISITIMDKYLAWGMIKSILIIGIFSYVLIKNKESLLNKIANINIGGQGSLNLDRTLQNKGSQAFKKTKNIAGIGTGLSAATIVGGIYNKSHGGTFKEGAIRGAKSFTENKITSRFGPKSVRSAYLKTKRTQNLDSDDMNQTKSDMKCFECNKVIEEGEQYYITEDNQPLCYECASTRDDFDSLREEIMEKPEEETTRCSKCRKRISIGDTVYEDANHDLICSECILAESNIDKFNKQKYGVETDPVVYDININPDIDFNAKSNEEIIKDLNKKLGNKELSNRELNAIRNELAERQHLLEAMQNQIDKVQEGQGISGKSLYTKREIEAIERRVNKLEQMRLRYASGNAKDKSKERYEDKIRKELNKQRKNLE